LYQYDVAPVCQEIEPGIIKESRPRGLDFELPPQGALGVFPSHESQLE